MPRVIDLYEGNGASQDLLYSLEYKKGKRINLKKNDNIPNDEIRSCVLHDIPKGALVRFYDNPDGKMNDDWTEIEVKAPHQKYIIRTLERTYDDEYVRVTYHHQNGLDGKVSRIALD